MKHSPIELLKRENKALCTELEILKRQKNYLMHIYEHDFVLMIRFRDALLFYASPSHREKFGSPFSEVENDKGRKAEQALKGGGFTPRNAVTKIGVTKWKQSKEPSK